MGFFDFFRRGKKKQDAAELEAQYEQALDPLAPPPQAAIQPPAPPAPAAPQPVALPPTNARTNAAVTAPHAAVPLPAAPPPPVPVAPPVATAPVAPEKPGLFGKLRQAVSKTRRMFNRRIAGLVGLGQKIDEALIEQVEEALIEADMGMDTTEMLVADIRKAWKSGEIVSGEDILPFIKADLKHRLSSGQSGIRLAATPPTVILVVGVNGSGKTTSIAKMARLYVRDGRRVLLAAGDTFRAAAVSQLSTWSERIGCSIVTGDAGSDPAAVAFRAVTRAVEEQFEVLLIDTAGRLHTQKNLMDELAKIHRVITKVLPDAPHETILVLDATTGQNAINQAQTFTAVAKVTGLFLAKLDGTAKGGAVLSIHRQTGIPVKFVGVGESFEDVQRFNAEAYVDALFEEEAESEM